MALEADTKDWTWVLERRCPECGFDTRTVTGREVAGLVRQTASTWRQVLALHRDLSRRPSEDRWSVLEYACHVRDVFLLFDRRLQLMLNEENPTFANWDQDGTALSTRYDLQVPATVAGELEAAAAVLARHFDDLTPDDWGRRGARSDGAQFTVETFARYLIHDPVHHLHDVG